MQTIIYNDFKQDFSLPIYDKRNKKRQKPNGKNVIINLFCNLRVLLISIFFVVAVVGITKQKKKVLLSMTMTETT